MEINITSFFNAECSKDYSASCAEIGQDAGAVTWAHAKEAAKQYVFLDDSGKVEEFKKYIKGFGAWDASEVEGMTVQDLNALLIQLISGDVREAGLDVTLPDWVAYEINAEAGNISGNIFKGEDGDIYYSF